MQAHAPGGIPRVAARACPGQLAPFVPHCEEGTGLWTAIPPPTRARPSQITAREHTTPAVYAVWGREPQEQTHVRQQQISLHR